MSYQLKGNEAFFIYCCGPRALPKAVTYIHLLDILHIKQFCLKHC